MQTLKYRIEPIQREVFSNGLTLLVQPLPGLVSVSVGLSVKTGSRDETRQEMGWSHLIEHMLFQGTRRRSMRELARVLTAVGGYLDACTGRENTTYYAKVPASYLSLALDVISDMLTNYRFNSSSLEKEKRIILEEIRMYEDAPDELIHDRFAQALWPNHPLGRPILGTRAGLKNVTCRDLRKYLQRHYQPPNLILAIAGNVRPAEASKLAKRYFGKPAQQEERAEPGPPVAALAFKSRKEHRRLEQLHICIGFKGLPYEDKRRLTAAALSNILGAGTNSRLFHEVRERRALAYSIYSFMDFFRDTGAAGVYLACHPRKFKHAMQIVHDELRSISTRLITDQEWHDVREQMQGGLLLSLESSSSHMWQMLQEEDYLQKHAGIPAVLRALGRISKQDILDLARDLFLEAPMTSAMIGPLPKTPFPDISI